MPRKNLEEWMLIGGRRLQGRRSDRGLTVADVAAACGVSATAIRRYESGRSCPLRPGISRKLAKALSLRSLSALYVDGRIEILGVE